MTGYNNDEIYIFGTEDSTQEMTTHGDPAIFTASSDLDRFVGVKSLAQDLPQRKHLQLHKNKTYQMKQRLDMTALSNGRFQTRHGFYSSLSCVFSFTSSSIIPVYCRSSSNVRLSQPDHSWYVQQCSTKLARPN